MNLDIKSKNIYSVVHVYKSGNTKEKYRVDLLDEQNFECVSSYLDQFGLNGVHSKKCDFYISASYNAEYLIINNIPVFSLDDVIQTALADNTKNALSDCVFINTYLPMILSNDINTQKLGYDLVNNQFSYRDWVQASYLAREGVYPFTRLFRVTKHLAGYHSLYYNTHEDLHALLTSIYMSFTLGKEVTS